MAFYILGCLLLASAALVVTCRNLVHSAIFLVVTFLALAGLYVSLDAEFIAAAQVLVYAGGIMVLFLFMVMLVSFRELSFIPQFHRQAIVGLLIGAVFFVTAVTMFSGADLAGQTMPETADALFSDGTNTGTLAMVLYTKYLFPFELVSVFLLSAMIGAILLARKED